VSTRLDHVCYASLPPDALAALAGLRRRRDVTVRRHAGRAWVRWPSGDDAVLACLLPVAGADFFLRRGDHWYRPGEHLPAFGLPPDDGGQPLDQALFPTRVEPTPVGDPVIIPQQIVLVRDTTPRPAAALRCRLAEVGRWADTATTAELAAVRGACCDGTVLLLGARLPALAGAERFWGAAVLVPLGLRFEPALPEAALREALGVDAGELLVLTPGAAEAVSRDALRPLTRAGVRLAVREGER
jgi:hypothetical protein